MTTSSARQAVWIERGERLGSMVVRQVHALARARHPIVVAVGGAERALLDLVHHRPSVK